MQPMKVAITVTSLDIPFLLANGLCTPRQQSDDTSLAVFGDCAVVLTAPPVCRPLGSRPSPLISDAILIGHCGDSWSCNREVVEVSLVVALVELCCVRCGVHDQAAAR